MAMMNTFTLEQISYDSKSDDKEQNGILFDIDLTIYWFPWVCELSDIDTYVTNYYYVQVDSAGFVVIGNFKEKRISAAVCIRHLIQNSLQQNLKQKSLDPFAKSLILANWSLGTVNDVWQAS